MDLTLFDTCEFCGSAPDLLRLSSLPPYGLNMETGRPYSRDEFDPDGEAGVIAVCELHEHARWDNGVVRVPSVERASADRKGSRQDRRASLRLQLIERLGGACSECGVTADPDLMRVLTPSRAGLAHSTTRWFEMILETPKLLESSSLACIDHGTRAKSGRAKGAKLACVEAYGGRCSEEGCEETQDLWLVRDPDTEPLLRPSGGRYSSVARYEKLRALGFPPGWSLYCPAHGVLAPQR